MFFRRFLNDQLARVSFMGPEDFWACLACFHRTLIFSTHQHLWVLQLHIAPNFKPVETLITFYYSVSPFQREETWFSQFIILLASRVLPMAQLAELLEA